MGLIGPRVLHARLPLGGYLAGRIISRDDRFRVAVSCEGVAGLRLLDPVSKRIQARWLGGDAGHVPRRRAAASPAEHARNVRTPVFSSNPAQRLLHQAVIDWSERHR